MADLHTLSSETELDAAFQRSHEHPVFLFKHSLTCPISLAAFDRFQEFLDEHDGTVDSCVIEVQPQRALSNEVETRTGVRHESPQAFLLSGGEVHWHASHGAITGASLGEALRSLSSASGE